jgi:RNA polymerase primary sigma factor
MRLRRSRHGCRRGPDYDRWQAEALTAWEQAGRIGIIEAVTGSGKTHVAIEALARLYGEDRWLNTVVMVPTLPLMDQWYEKLRKRFPNERVGRIGDKYREIFTVPPLAYVMTIQSARHHASGLLSHCWDPSSGGRHKSFLIADECHHYIDAPVWKRIIQPPYDWTYRMGLSATVELYEVDGLGKIVKTYTFREAYRDDLIPSFDLVNVGVDLTLPERDIYLDLSEKIREQWRRVFEEYKYELRDVPDHWLFRELLRLMGRCGSGKEPEIDKLFLLLFKRAEIHYMAENKMNLAERAVMQFIVTGRKTLVFFERIAAADLVNDNVPLRAAKCLQGRLASNPHVWCRTYHSGMDRKERDRVLEEFRVQKSGALLACHSLDEGVDVPDVDGAVLVASTQAARQRIQRIGRTLRRGNGCKRPIILTLFAKGTGDEGVTINDQEEFQNVARIHEIGAAECPALMQDLLSGKRPRRLAECTSA